ncbi:hypothetical protein VP01_1086g2 [Puccinia sorghi]|uniref:Uncharacterized protein n=1 Tax=Puccinia sorghi TaxID=27349 RepID=A0A0L6VUL0_9BASI|nr:hypothetical protein VP01_1086g2 [Puccinia sorghi]
MLSAIKRFAQEHGYVILICRWAKGKRKFCKFDRRSGLVLRNRLSPPQSSCYQRSLISLKNLTQASLKSTQILHVMQATKERNKNLLAKKNTIYAAKQRVKNESLQSLSPMFIEFSATGSTFILEFHLDSIDRLLEGSESLVPPMIQHILIGQILESNFLPINHPPKQQSANLLRSDRNPAFCEKNWQQIANPEAIWWKNRYLRCFNLTERLKMETVFDKCTF